MASINDLKQLINLHDLAAQLGLERPQGKGNYRSPQHEDKNSSLNIYQRHGNWYWTDFSGDDSARGSCVDLYIYVRGGDVRTAMRELHRMFGIATETTPHTPQENKPREIYETIAWRAQQTPSLAKEYLISQRKIPEPMVDRAIAAGAIGYNDYRSTKVRAGDQGHGGPGVVFLVRSLNPGQLKSVDIRYIDPAMNGGLKTQSFGQKIGCPWFIDLDRLALAKTIYVVESAINALTIEACDMPYTAALAVRAIKALGDIDWSWFAGKQVIHCFDNDEPDKQGRCAGQEASWQLYDILAGRNIAALLVDQSEWEQNDINDILQVGGVEAVRAALKRLQPWALQGLSGNFDHNKGRARLFLPAHDVGIYWRFRVKPDFTTYVGRVDQNPDGGEDKLSFEDVCGFRVAAISRVTIASANSVLSGACDAMPQTLFSVTVQSPRHGASLQRRVFEDEELHNADKWGKFGPVYKKSAFARMVNILERSSHLGSRQAINFVGLGWLNGKLVVNEGHNAFFTDPKQQCPYSDLIFPSGTIHDGATVLEAYSRTFRQSAGLIPLVWALGAHLKALMGFWPHLIMQAAKAAGKSTLTKRLEETVGMIVFGRQSIESSFRVLTSICHTSHPVGWEEISAGRQEIIDSAVSSLQQSYQHSLTRRGAKMMEFLVCAPVLLVGEDVPVKSLEGKVVRTDLTDRKGEKLPGNLPQFPVRQWLEFLSGQTRERVSGIYHECVEFCRSKSMATEDDPGAERMVENYAALFTAWALVVEFCGVDSSKYSLTADMIAQMNRHISDTASEREPWVWIMEVVLSEIDSGRYRHPYTWDVWREYDALYIRHTDMMHHIQHNSHLREVWNSLPIKSPKVLKQHLHRAGVVLADDGDKTISRRRVNHMLVISNRKLEEYGLTPAPVTEPDLYPN